MNPEGIKAQVFTLVIDQDRCALLNALWASIEDEGDPKLLIEYIDRNGLGECYNTLITELVDKKHDLGWCKDPKCDYK